jgi:tRNA A-37 threonylcarbamoyl transferase component Bud32
MKMHLVRRVGHPDFLDLPWHLPLSEWRSDRLVEVERGISRHVVRFANYDGILYALKELPRHLAEREYRLLRRLAEESIPVVEVMGVVIDRIPDNPDSAVLITRHLDFSLPYRTLFSGRAIPDLRNRLLDALAHLLVRLHLAGFFWGDCSLSNTLFRRDAGALAAYLVDAETGELHPQLSDGQREYDVLIAEQNIAGELMDVGAAGNLPEDLDPAEASAELPSRYGWLWSELTREEVFKPGERYQIDARLRRLNEMGFDVEEMELIVSETGYRMRLQTQVVEPGHHRRRLHTLTGLDVQENQASRLLNDIAGFRAYLESTHDDPLPESVAAYRWVNEVFEPTIAAIPEELQGKLQPAELFHEVLEHRWFLSEKAGRDVGLGPAIQSYTEKVLRFAPDEADLLTVPEAFHHGDTRNGS